MGKTFPTECPHGRILDFGDPDNPETGAEHCNECQAEPDEFEVVAYRYPAMNGGWGYSGARLSTLDEPLYRRVPSDEEARDDG